MAVNLSNVETQVTNIKTALTALETEKTTQVVAATRATSIQYDIERVREFVESIRTSFRDHACRG